MYVFVSLSIFLSLSLYISLCMYIYIYIYLSVSVSVSVSVSLSLSLSLFLSCLPSLCSLFWHISKQIASRSIGVPNSTTPCCVTANWIFWGLQWLCCGRQTLFNWAAKHATRLPNLSNFAVLPLLLSLPSPEPCLISKSCLILCTRDQDTRVHTLHKYRDRNQRRVAIILTCPGVRGQCDSPERGE